MKQTMTLAQVANDIENGNNLHEYYNNETVIKTGNFESFGDFMSYFDMHYRPMLERVENGEDISESDRHLLNFLASDLLAAFKTEDSDESDEPETIAIVRVTFADTENYERVKKLFDSEGPSQFWAGDWTDETRTIEFAEGNDPDALGAALCQEMDADGITGYTWRAETQRVD